MQLSDIYNTIKNDPYDITYLAIGSAVYRGTEPSERQQYPPFMEHLYNQTQYSIRLINIDMQFEESLFLLSYIPNLTKISENEHVSINNNTSNIKKISIIYVTYQLNLFKINNNNLEIEDLEWLDNINKLIMEQNNMLIVGNYIGTGNNKFEMHFETLYKNTIYEQLFSQLITYDFTVDGYGGCMCNLLENYPLIDFNKKQLIKLDNRLEELHKYVFDYIDNELVINKLKFIFQYTIYDFIDSNHYIYRNCMKDNFQPHMITYMQKTIFNKINIDNYKKEELITIFDKEELITIFQHALNNIKYFIELVYNIKKENYEQLTDLIDNIHTYDIYNWSQNLKSLIKIIISNHI